MKTNINQNNIVFVNLDTVTDVLAWDNQLIAALAVVDEHLTIGDRVIAMRGLKVVAAGWITEFLYKTERRCITHSSVRMKLHTLTVPVAVTPNQRKVLAQLAKACELSYPNLKAVLPIPRDYAPYFDTLIHRLGQWPDSYRANSYRDDSGQWKRAAALSLLERQDINSEKKINLLLALECRGALADYVFERDENRLDSDDDNTDLTLARIVPWEACTDHMRTDPDNYILVESELAQNFSYGMVSFYNDGRTMLDPALDEERFRSWILLSIEYPKLNKEQGKYMAYHREHVYKQWRTRLPKPLYVSDQQG